MEVNPVALDILFETSWEVCNKIGGIYTVLSTKAKTLQHLYKDKVVFVGPDVWTEDNPSPYFIEQPSVLSRWHKKAELPFGITVRTGRWDVPGKPIVVLVKFDSMFAHNNELFGEMWDRFHVDSLHAYGDYGEGCAFAHAAAIVIESIYRTLTPGSERAVAHFDEWTTGMGLLWLKAHCPRIATIFTTHATSIGRSICGNGKDLYRWLNAYDGDQMARELNMEAKHSLEKTAAHQADCFTTVSDVTATECEQLLSKVPGVVTPNGFEQNFVPAKTKYPPARKAARERMLDVAATLTGKTYPEDTFIVCTSGRCEYRNKGIDVFIDTVSALRAANPGRRILALVMVPAWSAGPRTDLVEAIAEGSRDVALVNPVITHNLHNFGEDPIYNRIKAVGGNYAGTDVDVVYVPCYLDGADGIFDMTYYQLLPGMDATVFPSYYEPWGYTPLESVAFGVPTVTTSLSGFGQWVLSTLDNDFMASGVKVIGRDDANYLQVVSEIASQLLTLCNASAGEIKTISAAAFATAKLAAWKYFIDYYIKAFEIAIADAAARNN